jgi:hypothetical protein
MKIINVILVSAIILTANFANAGLSKLILSDLSTSSGGVTSYNKTFDITDTYKDVSLFFDTEDIYNASFKHIELFLDGNLILDWGGSTYKHPAPNVDSSPFGSMKYKLYGNVGIDKILWDSIVADDQIAVSWKQHSIGDYVGDYVAFELTGNSVAVNAPSTYVQTICGLVLLSFIGYRRRKQLLSRH